MDQIINQFYDHICPALPVENAADQSSLIELTKALTHYNVGTSKFNTKQIANMVMPSQHLRRLILKYPSDINSILENDGQTFLDHAKKVFLDQITTAKTDTEALAAIRQWRNRSALTVALHDIAGLADIVTQMKWLSYAAEIALSASVNYLINNAIKRGKIASVNNTMRGCGWTILALGKMGAEELNYSSDIDLIILHDLATAPIDSATAQPFYVQLARDLIRLLSASTIDGIGWRVDLRLRPDPGATAVSIDLEAAVGYYESIARTWERAAFIRARPVAGDIEIGEKFLTHIQSFIWRRTLDYAVMDDMKKMLRRPPQSDGWLGYDLKIGKNGIRQIEFFTHVLQLVAGGREAALRHHQTIQALNALANFDWITQDQATALIDAYKKLRRIEHRLQMLSDSQTHCLPRSQLELEHFAGFMGHKSCASLCDALATIQSTVASHAEHKALQISSDFGLARKSILLDDHDTLVSWLTQSGFERPQDVADTLAGWMAGRIAATRSERARNLLNSLMPDILSHFSAANSPDDIFAALAQFIEGLPASVQIFSLLDHNRQLTRLLCDMLVLSPQICNRLRQHPALFDLLLYRAFFAPIDNAKTLAHQFHEKTTGLSAERALDQIKVLVRELKFRAQVQTLSLSNNTDSLESSLTAIADASINIILTLAQADMIRRHGNIKANISIIALGRLGIRQLTAGSDLDLLIVYDVAEGIISEGAKALDAASYFLRLAQTIVSWISTPTAEGTLYDVDLRLRPEGAAGAIATSLDRLKTYFKSDAWIWERQALTKARPIAGSQKLNNQVQKLINQVVNCSYSEDSIVKSVKIMHQRIHQLQKPKSRWQLRQLPGGLNDADLLIQAWRLQHGTFFNGSGQSAQNILETLQTEKIIDSYTYDQLLEASKFLNEIHHSICLTLGPSAPLENTLPLALSNFILARMDIADQPQLNHELNTIQANVVYHIETYLNITKNSS